MPLLRPDLRNPVRRPCLGAGVAVVAWLLQCGSGFAAQIPVDDLVRRSLRTHPGVAEMAALADSQDARSRALESPGGPQIGYSAGLSETTSVSQAQTTAQPFLLSSAGLSLRQRLFDFGRGEAAVLEARSGAEAARHQAALRAVDLAHGVRRAYLEWLRSRATALLAARRVEDATAVRDQAEAFWKAGKRPKIDLSRAAAALEQANAAHARARHSEQAAALAVGTATGQAEPPEGEPVLPAAYGVAALSPAEAQLAAQDKHPRLKVATERRAAARWALDGARKATLPELRADLSYGLRARDAVPGQNWSAGVSLAGPLFDGFASERALDQAHAGLRAEEAGLAAEHLAVMAAVRQATLAVSSAKLRIPAGEAAVRSAAENLSFATGRYQAGVGSVIEVGDAQTLLESAETELLGSRIDYHLAIADLLRAIGLTGLDNADSTATRN